MSTEDLFYRPHIEPTRDYRSDGVILHEEVENVPSIEIREDLTEPEKAYQRNVQSVERLLRIRQITPLLPKKIVDVINTIIDVTVIDAIIENEDPIKTIIEDEDVVIVIPEETTEDETKEIEVKFITKTTEDIEEENTSEDSTKDTYEVPTAKYTDEDDDYEWPDMTSSGFNIETEENDNVWDQADKQYLIDKSIIREDFSKEYNDVMESYVYQLLPVLDEAGVENPEILNEEYEGESVTGISEDNKYLNDIIVRNQLRLTELTDMFEKTHDLNNTCAILGAFDVVSQERTKYLKEKYKEAAAQNYLEMYDKNLLAAVREEYSEKYVKARSNAYKFFHSAVVISKDMLNLALMSNIAKCSLIKKGVDIFKKKDYENTTASNSTQTTKNSTIGQQTTVTKATDTSQKESSSTTDVPLTSGGGIGGAIKNSVNGTVKTVANEVKAQVAAKS